MATIFTKILQHELPGHFVYEDEVCGAFLSIAPLKDGHVLVVPRHEVDHWLDLEGEEVAHCFQVAQNIGKVLMKVFPARKVALMVAGLEVPHAHIHVVPIQSEADLNFANAQEVGSEKLQACAELIRKAMRNN